MESAALLYHEPDATSIAIYASFLLLLNFVNYILDKLIYCGLIGQIFLGVAWGTPGGQLLSQEVEKTITDLGYLGLILLVFEGGLSTNLTAFKGNLFLSVIVALTGVATPLSLSFLLIKFCDASVLQAFAAGCALSSTSLGTVFTVLKSSGLFSSRLGTVLTSAAMLDDIFGLVLVQIIANLGSSRSGSFSAGVVLRPIFVSVGFALVVPISCYLLGVLCSRFKIIRQLFIKPMSPIQQQVSAVLGYSAVLFALAVGAVYAGTSILFSAYLAGAAISWFDAFTASSGADAPKPTTQDDADTGLDEHGHSARPESVPLEAVKINQKKKERIAANTSRLLERKNVQASDVGSSNRVKPTNENNASHSDHNRESNGETSATAIKEEERTADIVPSQPSEAAREVWTGLKVYEVYYASAVDRILKPFFFASIGFSIPVRELFGGQIVWRGLVYAFLMLFGKLVCGTWLIRLSKSNKSEKSKLFQYQAQSLYPAAILGSAMVSRGEIGFLISAVAQSNGIFEPAQGQYNLYLIVTWAILVCTILGPIAVGLLARRVKKLQKYHKDNAEVHRNPLGLWGDI